MPNFSKQTGREERKELDDDEVYVGDIVTEETNLIRWPNLPESRVTDFGKGGERFDHEQKILEDENDFG